MQDYNSHTQESEQAQKAFSTKFQVSSFKWIDVQVRSYRRLKDWHSCGYPVMRLAL